MLLDPKAHKNTFGKQEELNASAIPPSGTYIVVNKTLQFKLIGKKGTKKCEVTVHILEAIAGENGEDVSAYVGTSFKVDLWWDLTKEPNERRLTHLAMACGTVKPFDPDIEDTLVKAITGVPYQMKMERRENESRGDNGQMRTFTNAEVLLTGFLKPAKRKKFTDAPDWGKTIPALDQRMLKLGDFTKKNGSGGGQGGDSFSRGDTPPDPQGDALAGDELDF